MRFTGEKKKDPAVAELVATSPMLQRRRELSDQIATGKWSIDLPDWRQIRARERAHRDQDGRHVGDYST